jgi:hypothetical protein
MIAVSQIREQLGAVVKGRSNLEAFQDWLVRASWNMHKDSASDAIQAVGKIELRLAEADYSEVPESELIQDLIAALPSVEIMNTPVLVTISTSGVISGNVFSPPLLRWVAAGIQPEKEFGSAPPVPA